MIMGIRYVFVNRIKEKRKRLPAATEKRKRSSYVSKVQRVRVVRPRILTTLI